MSGKELHTCDLCDERTAKHVLYYARGVRLAVCGSCATESRRDGIDLELTLTAVDREGEGKR